MEVKTFHIEGPRLLSPVKHGDKRGFFSEVYNKARLAEAGITADFVQDNHSYSAERGVIRGLHFQSPPHAQGKLVRVTRGVALDVIVDIRHGSPTFGEHLAVELSAENWRQFWVPPGFAHAFCTLSKDVEFLYKVSGYYAPDCDFGLAFDDPDLGIDWPVAPEEAILSDKDRKHPRLKDLPVHFHYDD